MAEPTAATTVIPGRERPDVTVAIVNYNGRRFLETLLPSLARQTLRGFSIHVVDDASTDDGQAYVERAWPEVRWLGAAENRGITATMARAVAGARTEYVAVLNNDVELDPRWLEQLLTELEARPRAAAVEGKTLEFDRRTHLDGAGDRMRRNGYPDRRGQGEPDDGRLDAVDEVFAVSGTAALFRRAAFDDVGPYDVDLRAYYEDVDWGFRARLRGWTAWYVPSAVAYHMGSATVGRAPGPFTTLIIRNQILVLVKNMPWPLMLRWALRIAWFQVTWLPRNVMAGIGRHHLRALVDVAHALPRFLRKRRDIQRRRVASSADLARVIR
jgi:GT2 family glycosyltransferase